MGNFYSNIVVKGRALDDVVLQINTLDHTTYVSRPENGFVCVFPWDYLAVFEIANDLSRVLSCVTFAAMNHDDDVFMCKLYESGTLIDEYNSTPEFFGTGKGPTGGNAEALIKAFDAASKPKTVSDILKKKYRFAIGRHTDLVRELGLPEFTVGSGYEYIQRDDFDGIDSDDLIETGSGKDQREGGIEARQAAAKKAQREALNNFANSPSAIRDLVGKTQLQAQDMIKAVQESLTTGSAGDNDVVVTGRGNFMLESIVIKESAISPNEPQALEDLLVTAMNDCTQKVREQLDSIKTRMLANVTKQLG